MQQTASFWPLIRKMLNVVKTKVYRSTMDVFILIFGDKFENKDNLSKDLGFYL